MHVLTLAVLAFCNLPDIASHDWESADKSVFLSLRPVKSETSGAAWMFRQTEEGTFAGQGCYTLSEKDGAPLLRLLMSRRWRLTVNPSGSQWDFDTPYYLGDSRARGADLEVTMTKSGMTLSTLQLNSCDRAGIWTGLVKSKTCALFSDGEIVKVSPSAGTDALADRSVPCYVLRKDWQKRSQTFPHQILRRDLLQEDWFGWSSGRLFYIFSARPAAENGNHGAAWLIAFHHSQDGVRTTACRGHYHFYSTATPDQETLSLEFSFRRIFQGQSDLDGPLHWTVVGNVDLDDIPGSFSFQVPLTDRAFSTERQPLFLDNVYYVNSAGKAERRFDSSGFLGLTQTERDPRSFSGLSEGDAIVLTPGKLGAAFPDRSETEQAYFALLKASVPPGFDPRSPAVLQPVSRPVLRDPTNDAAAAKQKTIDQRARRWRAETIFRRDPKNPTAATALAWVLSTSPDSSLRDGKRAVRLASDARDATAGKDPSCMEALAAAYAETGDFTLAIRWQKKAIELTTTTYVTFLEERLALYQNATPYRSP